jgi:hypothetical protein
MSKLVKDTPLLFNFLSGSFQPANYRRRSSAEPKSPIMTNSGSIVVMALSAAALCAAAPVLAGTVLVPPSGETTTVTHYTGLVINTEYLGDGASESLVEMTGISRNTVGQSAFDGMHAHCLMLSAIISGKSSVSGRLHRNRPRRRPCLHVLRQRRLQADRRHREIQGDLGIGALFGHAGAFGGAGAIWLCDEARHHLDDSSSAARCQWRSRRAPRDQNVALSHAVITVDARALDVTSAIALTAASGAVCTGDRRRQL